MAFSPDGSLIACAGTGNNSYTGNSVRLWNVKSGKLIADLQHKPDYVDGDTVAFSPDGLLLASGSHDSFYGGAARLWNVKRGKLSATLLAEDTGILSVAFSRDGSLLAAASSNGAVRLWDVKTDKLIANLVHKDWVTSIAFNPAGSLLASGSTDGVRLWGIPTDQTSSAATATP